MSSNSVIEVAGLGKCYHVYDKPRDRLLQMLARGRRRYYREFWALRDANFRIGRGETVGIIGRNGSGKSTLLQMICGTVTPTSGSVRTAGRVAALLELGAGFNPEFTGRENVLLNAAILGVPREAMTRRMQEVAEFSELGDFLDQPVKAYSSGMFARLAFSIAIHVDPDIVVVDEALAVGDARFVAKCMRRIRDLQERGVSILFVSHDTTAVRTLCQRAIWLDKGRLIEDGEVFPVTGRYMSYMFREDGAASVELASPHPQSPSAPNPVVETNSAPGLDDRPVTHWGSRKGLVTQACICDAGGQRRDVIEWGESVEVRVWLALPPELPRAGLSVAISIKDLKGSDLVVATTQETGLVLPEQHRLCVVFRLCNLLLEGRYLLVAAVENRSEAEVYYYEYVEGAHYFASHSVQRSGVFQPYVEQHVEIM
ncbi:MAG TPA: ABC transporter ATP-binding protein [Ramlibacter sp.]|jgi:lipopolysaccharide transport system ATP-binding protein|uniref:ABC transporter ATP-binding protein n=1 Tax=Ramlibacter sp. TaxID=1917967 RepID=UPI002D51A675|nr:ABC transporter ATP-binding protein [Ramlibacter sp.]HZY20063.1 ABC transporter ATP-binding protein [Ramlibacter sp.]